MTTSFPHRLAIVLLAAVLALTTLLGSPSHFVLARTQGPGVPVGQEGFPPIQSDATEAAFANTSRSADDVELPTMLLPYASSADISWTGGPHLYNSSNLTATISTLLGSGLDFAGSDPAINPKTSTAYGSNFRVLPIADGEVLETGTRSDYGEYVAVRHELGGTVSLYCHLLKDSILVKVGDTVHPNETVLALAGKSGSGGGTANHLHLELRQGNSQEDCAVHYGSNCWFGSPVSWHDSEVHNVALDGYRLFMYLSPDDWDDGFNYEGSAIRAGHTFKAIDQFPFSDYGTPKTGVVTVDTEFPCDNSDPSKCTEDNDLSTSTQFALASGGGDLAPLPLSSEAEGAAISFAKTAGRLISSQVLTAASITPTRISTELQPGGSHSETIKIGVGDAPVGKADVMFVFDLTGSMGGALNQAKSSAVDIMNDIRSQVAFSWFGLASFMDYPKCFAYPGYSACYGSGADVPWRLNMTMREPIAEVADGIQNLSLGYGGDGPEDYTRVLYELKFPEVGWRSSTKKIAVLFGDAPTHDLDFAGYNYGGDPGRNEIAGDGDDLDFQTVVQEMAAEGIAMIAVDSGGSPQSIATFKGMSIGYADAPGTGGQYYRLTDAAQIPAAVVQLIEEETQKIDRLSFKVTDGYEHWVQITPPEYTNVPAGSTLESSLQISVPDGTAPGYYPFVIRVVADGSILGAAYVDVKVPSSSPISDLGFKPNEDGFGFPNTSATLTWAMFSQFFGKDAVEYANGDHIWAADQFYNSKDRGYRDAGKGLCAGFSVTSLINFEKWTQPNAGSFSMPRHEPLYPVKKDDTMMSAITFAQGIQKGMEVPVWQEQTCEALGESSWKWYEFLKSLIQNGTPAVLRVSWDKPYPSAWYCDDRGLKEAGAHALVPYKFEEPSGDKAYVYVYDSNLPGNDKHRVEFDKKSDSWSYDWPVQLCPDIKITGTGCSVLARPLELYRHQGIAWWNQHPGAAAAAPNTLPETTGARVFTVSGPASLLFTDDVGRRLGWDETGFHDEIPGASYVAPENGDGNRQGAFYYVPVEISYRLRLNGEAPGAAEVSVWGNGYMVSASGFQVTAGSSAILSISADGRSITIEGTSQDSHATLTVDRLLSGEDRAVTAGNVAVGPGDAVALSLIPDGVTPGVDRIKLSTNSSSTSAYDLALQRSGGDGLVVFGHAGATLQANSDQIIDVADWSNLDVVTVGVDVGHDGLMDGSQVLYDESTPSKVEVESDSESIHTGGQQVGIAVRVKDQFGQFAPDGAVVNFSTTLGSLSASSAVTQGGLVHVTLTSGSAMGAARVTATTGAVSGYVDVQFEPFTLYLPLLMNGRAEVGLASKGTSTPTSFGGQEPTATR